MDAVTLSAAKLSAGRTLARRPGFTFMDLFDSVGARGGAQYDPAAGQSSLVYDPRSWQWYASLLSDSRALHLGSASTSGLTSKQIMDTHLPTVLAAKPDYVILPNGQNDNDQGDWLLSGQGLDAIRRMAEACRAAGIRPILTTNIAYTTVLRKPAGIRALRDRLGCPLVDFYAATADPTTGLLKAGYSDASDVTTGDKHLGEAGAQAAGQALADVFRQIIPQPLGESWLGVTDGYYRGANQWGGLALGRPLLLTDGGGANPAPNSWTVVAAGTTALTTDTACLGRKWTITRSGGADAKYQSGDWIAAAGDSFLAVMRIGANVEAVGGNWKINLETSDGTVVYTTGIRTKDVPFGHVLGVQFTMPSGLTGTGPRWVLRASGADGAALSIAQPTAYNLTQSLGGIALPAKV